jgi:hypothetical protein
MQNPKVQSLANDLNMQDENFNQSNETVIQLYHSYQQKKELIYTNIIPFFS